ncbi:MAG: hypothetical protein FJ279_18165 [Planctomycetes bacterium]|nr:hypothetical protein [Planctomycetota bacterium]
MKGYSLTAVLLAFVLFVGCASKGAPPGPSSPHSQESAATSLTHVLAADTHYYLDGPQQARPPDGLLKAQTKVRLIRDAGSYCLVQAENGVKAYVSTAALKKLQQ